MRIRRLELRNFRNFREARLEFPDGVIGLVGRNGAGKSTLIEAVGWAVFGRFASRTKRMEDVKRRDAGHPEECRVVLEFEFSGHAYEVARELRGKNLTHTAFLNVDGEVVVQPGAHSADAVTRYLERLFHTDRDSFFTSLVARQKELDSFTNLTPAERKEQIIRLLRIDAVDDAIGEARRARREARAKAEALAATLKDPKLLADREGEAKRRRREAEARLQQVTKTLGASKAESETRRRERETWQGRANEHAAITARLMRERERLEARRAQAREARATLERLESLAKEAEALTPRAARLPEARRDLERLSLLRQRRLEAEERRRELQAAEATAEALTAELAKAEEIIVTRLPARKLLQRVQGEGEATRQAIAAAERQAATLAAEEKRARADRAKAAERRRGIERLGRESPCPTCERPLEDHYESLLASYEREIASHDSRLEELATGRGAVEARLSEAREKLTGLREREREILVKVEELTRLEGERGQLHPRLASERKRVRELAQSVEQLELKGFTDAAYEEARARVQGLEKAAGRLQRLQGELSARKDVEARMTRLQAESGDLARGLEVLEGQVKALAFDAERFREISLAAERAQEAVAEAREKLARTEGEIQRLKDEEARARADREEQAARAREVEALRADALYLERIAGDREQGLLPEFKDYLVGRIRPALAEAAGDLFRDLTDGRYAGLEIGEGYDVQVLDDGEAFPLDRFSGGEADLANLCLRLAIGQIIAERAGGAEFGFIAFDEIFGSQDEVRKANILRALARLGGKFRQILVITHVEDVKDSVEHVVRVEETREGVSVLRVE